MQRYSRPHGDEAEFSRTWEVGSRRVCVEVVPVGVEGGEA